MTPEPLATTELKDSQQAVAEISPVLSPQLPEGVAPQGYTKALLSALAAKLPLQLDLRLPLPSFRVQNLLSLEKGQVIESAWPHTEDLPLWSGGVHLVWTEFEVVDQKLAVRVTRLV
ncbi:FliM/FliN family flagellar motor switch protein [Alloacidobacterium dinghuense]|uniref:FliM/FliN family flagellar motor switch protein n=1 Tax=Alloacidobacterium dinghuense TaxID=2763107 RepID=A0A7G8BNN8_9BACT|nr:FliM/FliN family flagellar motor C-terminal domain-containing protein [Alloacidobacterium dinghuense]QNI34158.1 FliM/FliN family flagellar motor switch protein [Alloacidobacterium dinghuense]